MGHNHEHNHSTKNIKTAFFLNLGFTIFEIVGGFYVNSVAIISDAFHDMGDSISLGFSWYLQEKSKKQATKEFTFGYKRFSLLGALVTGFILLGGSIFVIFEAVKRIITPEHANATGMLIFAVVGILVNGYAAYKMSTGKTLNERVVMLHLLEDVLGWVAILIVSIVLHFKDIQILDPILSLLITSYILWNSMKRLWETLKIFLQATPTDIDSNLIKDQILELSGVSSMHDMHIWSLDGEQHVFTAHVKLTADTNLKELISVRRQIRDILKTYPFKHYTIQTEIDEKEV